MKKFLLSMCLLTISGFTLATDTPESLEGVKKIDAKEAKELMDKGAKMYDVRVANEFAEEHIVGAISLPYKEKSKKDVSFDEAEDKFDDSKLPESNMIFQCNGAECWKSYKASKWAVKKGKKQVYWFRGGIPEWKKAGFPVGK